MHLYWRFCFVAFHALEELALTGALVRQLTRSSGLRIPAKLIAGIKHVSTMHLGICIIVWDLLFKPPCLHTVWSP
jgi:hypothetical protein